jgi:TRAP transporter TAXI family solute receptor
MLSSFSFASGSDEKAGTSEKSKKQFIQIKSSAIGGSWYAGGAAWAKLISENTDFIAMNSASPGLTNESIIRMSEGKAQLAFADGIATLNAYEGRENWDSKVDVRALFGLWPGVYNIIVFKDSGIKSVSDLKGKSVATYVEGEPAGAVFLEYLSRHGVDESNTKIYRIMKNDATRMFVDGKVDCLIYAFGHGHAKLKEIVASRKIKFIVGNDAENKRFTEKYPYYYLENFGSEFGVEDELQFVTPYFTLCMADFPEEQAYLMTKVWWENWDFLSEVLPKNIPYVNKKDPMAGVPVPIHPGAERYFKEIGLMK